MTKKSVFIKSISCLLAVVFVMSFIMAILPIKAVAEKGVNEASEVDAMSDESSGASLEAADDTDTKNGNVWIWLKWLLIFLLLLALFLWYMLQKVLPSDIKKSKVVTFWTLPAGDLDGDSLVMTMFNRKSQTFAIDAQGPFPPDDKMKAVFTVKAVDNRFVPSRRRRFVITKIVSNCESVFIGAAEYVCVGDQWGKKANARAVEGGRTVPPMEHIVAPNATFTLVRNDNGVECAKLEIKTKTK